MTRSCVTVFAHRSHVPPVALGYAGRPGVRETLTIVTCGLELKRFIVRSNGAPGLQSCLQSDQALRVRQFDHGQPMDEADPALNSNWVEVLLVG